MRLASYHLRRLAGLLCLGCLSPHLVAYYHFVHYHSSSPAEAVIEKFDLETLVDDTVFFYVSDRPPRLPFNDSYIALLSQIRQALAVWDSVPTSRLRVGYGGVTKGDLRAQSPAGEIVFAELPPGVIGLGGPVTRGRPADGFVPIVRSQVILSNDLTSGSRPRPSFSELFFNSLVHEIGHALGLQHSLSGSAMSTDLTRATTRALPLAADDVAGLSLAYPAESFSEIFGSIHGRVTARGRPLHLASVVALGQNGIVVSALTAADGSYHIEGLLPGNYLLYVHPLPPATQQGLGPANIILPTGPDGTPVQAGGPFRTTFYGGTTFPRRSEPVEVRIGEATEEINFQVQPRENVPLHSVTTYSFPGNGAPGVHPAFLDVTRETGFVVAAGQGLWENLPLLEVEPIGTTVQSLQLAGYSSESRLAQLDFQFSPFNNVGDVHLLFRLPDDIYVLPRAVRLTPGPAPVIHWVAARPDVSEDFWSVRGANFDPRTTVFFDGVQAPAVEFDPESGALLVKHPPGPPGHQAVVTVYNPHGQSSAQTLPDGNITFSYPPGPRPSIEVSPGSAAAGRDLLVEIKANNVSFAAGEAIVGFGASDIVTRDLEVLAPDRLRAAVTVRESALPGAYTVSVTNGLQLMTLPGGFRVLGKDPGDENRPLVRFGSLVNSATWKPDLSPGVLATLWGANLSAKSSRAPVVTLDGQHARILRASTNRIDLQIPLTLEPGRAELHVYTGGESSNPILVRIDRASPGLFGVYHADGTPANEDNPARSGEVLTIAATGLGRLTLLEKANGGGTARSEPLLYVILDEHRMNPLEIRRSSNEPGLFWVRFPTPATGAANVSVSLLVDGFRSNTVEFPVASGPAGNLSRRGGQTR